MVVVERVCPLPVALWHQSDWWQGLVVGHGVSVVQVMVWCSPVRRVEWVALGVWLRWGVVMMDLAGIAVLLGSQGVGVRGARGVLMVLVVRRPLTLRE